MTVNIYTSNDIGAPQLSGTAGSLVAVLDAVLVGTVGIAYGSTPSAGWTKAYSGTNAADFRMGGGLQYYLSVNDNGPGLGTFQEARVRGYEEMTVLGVGTNPFPTVTQAANGLFVRKAVALGSTIRPWIIFADDRTFYMFNVSGDTAGIYCGCMFGEFYSFKPNDPGRCMIIARGTENIGSLSTYEYIDQQNRLNTVLTGHYIARDVVGSPGGITCGKFGDLAVTSITSGASELIGNISMANPADNRVYIAPITVGHTVGGQTVRGRMRGFWQYCHPLNTVSDGDQFSGSQTLLGRSFRVVKGGGMGGVYLMETSNTWETN